MSLSLPNPQHTAFGRWSAVLVESLARYNVPNPESEDLWLDWAKRIYSIPQMQKLGVVDPRMFLRWQDWATTILQVPN